MTFDTPDGGRGIVCFSIWPELPDPPCPGSGLLCCGGEVPLSDAAGDRKSSGGSMSTEPGFVVHVGGELPVLLGPGNGTGVARTDVNPPRLTM